MNKYSIAILLSLIFAAFVKAQAPDWNKDMSHDDLVLSVLSKQNRIYCERMDYFIPKNYDLNFQFTYSCESNAIIDNFNIHETNLTVTGEVDRDSSQAFLVYGFPASSSSYIYGFAPAPGHSGPEFVLPYKFTRIHDAVSIVGGLSSIQIEQLRPEKNSSVSTNWISVVNQSVLYGPEKTNQFAFKVKARCVPKPPLMITKTFQEIQQVRSVQDLPKAFCNVFIHGEKKDIPAVLYARTMPDELVEYMTNRMLPLQKDPETINRISSREFSAKTPDPYYAGTFKDKPLRYIICPTHFLNIIRFDKKGPPSEDFFPMALTDEGFKVIGVVYAERIAVSRDSEIAATNKPGNTTYRFQ